MKKGAVLENPFDTRKPTLGEALDELDRQARDVLTKIANDPARSLSTHDYHGDLSSIETALGDLLVPLARRRM